MVNLLRLGTLASGINAREWILTVRLYWQNFLTPELLQAAMPKMMVPSPTLRWILGPHHISTKLGHTDERPFAPWNVVDQTRICMPTVVSFIRSNAYRTKANGEPGEGEVFNLAREEWKEPNCQEKEQMMGYMANETECPPTRHQKENAPCASVEPWMQM